MAGKKTQASAPVKRRKTTTSAATSAFKSPAENAMRQLNVLDSAFLQMDTADTPMTGGFLHIYAPVPGENETTRYSRLLLHIERCLDNVPILRRAIVRSPLDIDHGWFVDGVEVDLGYHVRRHALPLPGSAEQLNDLYARIMVQPMDLARPPWEIHVIDSVHAIDGVPKGGFAVIVKFHHAGVDGRSAAEIIAALHRTDPKRDNFKPRPHQPATLPPPPTLINALLRSAERYTDFATALGQEAAGRLPALSRSAGKLLSSKLGMGNALRQGEKKSGISVPQTIFNTTVSTDRISTHLSFDLDDIKRIRQYVAGATVNDVYLAVVGGALRRFLQTKSVLPKQSLVAGVTIDVRSDQDVGKGGNQFAFSRIALGTTEPNAARRLQHITEATARVKNSVKGQRKEGSRKPIKWTMIVPAPLLLLVNGANRLGIVTRMAPLFNLLATNVPGPRETLYLDGAKLIDFSGAPPISHGIGLAVNATSYNNSLRVSVWACRKEIPEPERMRQYMQDSFDELTQAFDKPSTRVVAKKPAKKKPVIRNKQRQK